ncbi:MAG TPA: hypothetical protein VNQ32_07800 [Steroidobacteraceae bacterium]|nr:hypothetical protein [Steroidobacteraceae bacterium]
MSFREKTAWITLLAVVAVSLLYWFHVRNPFVPHSAPHVLHAMGLSLLAYLLIELIGWLVLRWRHPRDAREPRDERERLIDLRALRVAYYVFLSAAMFGVFATLHLAGGGAMAAGMAVFSAFVLSQACKHFARIVLYRRGF